MITELRKTYSLQRTDVINDLSRDIGRTLQSYQEKGIAISPMELMTAVYSVMLADGVRTTPRRVGVVVVGQLPPSSAPPNFN